MSAIAVIGMLGALCQKWGGALLTVATSGGRAADPMSPNSLPVPGADRRAVTGAMADQEVDLSLTVSASARLRPESLN